LNKHEINYSTAEKELLAVVFGVQTHRCFLYGRKFKIVTDHAALKWLITVKNHQCARLTRWVLKLAEYEFEVIHRPGKRHINTDVLSRHVAAAVSRLSDSVDEVAVDVKNLAGVSLNKEVIMRAQADDEFCQQIYRALLEGKALPYFRDQDLVLYHRASDPSEGLKVVIPVSLREQIRQHHGPFFAGH
jgi:hypothetical protein